MSPRTRLIPLGVLLLGVLALLGACGEPPRQLPASPPYAKPSAPPISLSPSLPLVNQPLPGLSGYPPGASYPGFPGYTGYPAYPTLTTPATTVSPTPTPSHAPRCSGSPTGAQILNLIRNEDGIPDATLKVTDGPYCSGTWTFTAVGLSGESADEDETIMVVSTGKGSTLALVAAGSEVCIDRVQNDAPSGIRVLACGF